MTLRPADIVRSLRKSVFDHVQISLAGFMDSGPMIAGWVDE